MMDDNRVDRSLLDRYIMNKNTASGNPSRAKDVTAGEVPEKAVRTLPFNPDENYGRWAPVDDVKGVMKPVDIRGSHDIGEVGVPIYYEGDTAYVDRSDSHTLIIGSTGSRKTRSSIAPLLKLMARSGESVVVADPKGELLDRTYRDFTDNGYEVRVINLRRTDCSDRWSPLAIPYRLIKSKNPEDVSRGKSYVRELAADMIPIVNMSDPYWETTAQRGLNALMVTLINTARKESEVNLSNLVMMINQIFESESNMSRFLNSFKGNEPEYIAVKPIVNNAPNTRACILSMLYQGLSAYTSDETVIDMLSESSFDMMDLGRRRMALFMTLPDENTALNSLASMLISQLYGSLISLAQSMEGEKVLPVRVNFVLDEFANLPPVNGMAGMITASRGRNIRFILAIQDMFQLNHRYGYDGRTIASNCTNWIYLYSRQIDFLNELSEMVGRDRDGKLLISPSKLMNLDSGRCEALVFAGRMRPFLTRLKDISEYPGTSMDYPLVPREVRNQVTFDFLRRRCRKSDNRYAVDESY